MVLTMSVSADTCHTMMGLPAQQSAAAWKACQNMDLHSCQAVPGKLSKPRPAGANPGTVEELEEVIANNCPVFYFHPAEK